MTKKASKFPMTLYVMVEEEGCPEEWLRAEPDMGSLARIGKVEVAVYELKSVGTVSALPVFVEKPKP